MLTECFRCGVCCIKYQAPLTCEEVRRISGFLGLTAAEFSRIYVDYRWQGKEKLLMHKNGHCPFLDYDPSNKSNGCRIHVVRPAACRDWAPGPERPECREGLSKLWQLTSDDSGNPEGSPRQIYLFKKFLESLNRHKGKIAE